MQLCDRNEEFCCEWHELINVFYAPQFAPCARACQILLVVSLDCSIVFFNHLQFVELLFENNQDADKVNEMTPFTLTCAHSAPSAREEHRCWLRADRVHFSGQY